MAEAGPRDVDIQQIFPATLEEVDRFCHELRATLSRAHQQREEFVIELLLREMLNNAVIHGSRQNPRLKVRCAVTISGPWLVIRVADGGLGFDWRHASQTCSLPHAVSGRGLSILREYGAELVFNQMGNELILRRRLRGFL